MERAALLIGEICDAGDGLRLKLMFVIVEAKLLEQGIMTCILTSSF